MMRFIAVALLVCGMAAAVEIPRQSPEYAVTLPNGQQLSIGQHKGKVIALEFLFTTCPHCQQTGKLLSKLYTAYGPKGFQPIGVAINPNPDVPNFVRQFGINYPVGTASRESAFTYLQHTIMSPNFYVPQLVFIDRTGKIRAQYSGNDPFFAKEEDNVRAMIEKLLAEGGAAKTAKPAAAAKKKATS